MLSLRIATHFAYPLELAKGLGASCGAPGPHPADLTVTGLAKALPLAALGSRNKSLPRSGASRSVRAGRKHSGSPRSEDLPSVALNTTGAQRTKSSVRHFNISKIPCKFPALC